MTEQMAIKNPELPQDQTQVMTGATQHHIHLVTLPPLEVIASKQAVGFEMANDRFDGLASTALAGIVQQMTSLIGTIDWHIETTEDCEQRIR